MNKKAIGAQWVTVFVCGATTLALELISSRIMRPYFGESLLIWAGILSITLLALAVGYYWGGDVAGTTKSLPTLFALFPVLSAVSLAIVSLIYPTAFLFLAQWNILAGAFVAAGICLLVPLVFLSALNPLLVASLMQARAAGSDAGAGRVYFISTVGSVLGVLVSAFVFIPHLSNYACILLLSVSLCVMAMLYLIVIGHWHKTTWILAVAGLLLACAVFVASPYTRNEAKTTLFRAHWWTIVKHYPSFFGSTKVVKVVNPASGGVFKLLFQEGIAQAFVTEGNESVAEYPYVLEALVTGHVPNAKNVLCLGLGVGNLPRQLQARGIDVEVVEINPDCVRAAVEHFGFDKGRIPVYVEDARSFVKRPPRLYDAVVVDIFQADLAADYLLSREFFTDLRKCLRQDGVSVIHLSYSMPTRVHPFLDIYKTIRSAFPNVAVFYDGSPTDGSESRMSCFVGFNGALRQYEAVEVAVPSSRAEDFRRVLDKPKHVSSANLALASVLTDDRNTYQSLAGQIARQRRHEVLRMFPPELFVN